ncbi:Campylo_MOMP domain-containing protein [Malaciobacter halophilus]|uniref:major outer membrane protein n=1 Tax=Malaciobacter halophilus TaxID=197482 RepID=UPI000E0A4F74|nr:major outer membrane protein [Malaciobacter halophilus]AXH08705.1 Campylo_MOMP domain-containing protein [Malaciobacter halophilus]
MKKFAKMSLVAAVAVAGLSTTSSAKALEEAIKNVDVSGTVVYRYDDRSFDENTKDKDTNNYKIGLTLKSQVNDDVTAVTRFLVAGADGGFASLNHTNGGDANVDVELSNVYFSYTGIANTTVNVGKQGLTTPWTVAIDSDGNEQTGTGILALTNVGPVTLAGAYFNQTNLGTSGDILPGLNSETTVTLTDSNGDTIDLGSTLNDDFGDKNIATLGLMGNIGPVALDAWYLDMQDVFDTYTLGALAKFNISDVKLSIGARHTELDLDDVSADDSLTKVELGAKMGIFGANVGYGWTDSEGGIGGLDNDAKTAFQGWTMNLNGVNDASLLKLNVNAQVLPSLNLALNYNVLDRDDESTKRPDTTDKEYYLQATYQMSKNFGGYIRFGEADLEDQQTNGHDNDGTIGRLQVQYSF